MIEEKLSTFPELHLDTPWAVPTQEQAMTNFSPTVYGANRQERSTKKVVKELKEGKKTFGLTRAAREKYTNPEILLPPHLRQDLEKRKDLLRRVDLELQRCCSTTREQLQKKINACKVSTTTRTCADIANDSKLSAQQKLLLLSKSMVELRLCRDYRKMMNQAFDTEMDFKNKWELQAHENHLLQENSWKEEEEKCRQRRAQAAAYASARRQQVEPTS